MRRKSLLAPLVLAVILAAGVGTFRQMHEASAQAVPYHPGADCSSVAPTLSMSWARLAGTQTQWIEISLQDNGFADGTFKRVNLSSDQETVTVSALARDIPNYWRVVSITANGEIPSDTRAVVPCGAPFLLWGPLECRNFTTASVNFRWAPSANYEGEQWIEFDSNGDWTGADFWRAGPYSPALERARRSGFLDGVGYLFRIVHEVDGVRETSGTGWFMPNCTPDINPNIYESDDRLSIPSISVDAPVNVLDVGFDATLGVPSGGHDVVRYDFKAFPALDGVVGGNGPKLIGGHYDYHVIGPAVFWDLDKLRAGDVIHYDNGGIRYTYVVDWVTQLPFSESLTPYIRQSQGDTLMLVTCFGEFDRQQFGGYDQRTLVHATRVQ